LKEGDLGEDIWECKKKAEHKWYSSTKVK